MADQEYVNRHSESNDSVSGEHSVDADSLARQRLKRLWQPGDLFHNFCRYPQKPDAPRVDRLAHILSKGVVAPASCEDGSVHSDLTLAVIGVSVPYDSLVFLHRCGPQSGIYISDRPDHFAVLIDPKIPVLTP